MEEQSISALQLFEIAQSDLEDVARFIQRWSNGSPAQIMARLSWLLLENPARRPDQALGWFLRRPSGDIVGCMCCAPQKFCFDQKTMTLMMASSFFVDQRCRGVGASILMKFMELGRQSPLFTSSASPLVAKMWEKLGGYAIGNSDHEILGVLRWQPVIAEIVHRAVNNNLLAQGASTLASPLADPLRRLHIDSAGCELVELENPEEVAALVADSPRSVLTASRDVPYLRWRYFSPGDPTTHVFAFVTPRSGTRCMVAVNLRRRGYAQQIRTLHVLDVWGAIVPEDYAQITACLANKFDGQIDVIVYRCLNPTVHQLLCSKGFLLRRFDAPIAWCMDRFSLLPSVNWYFVPADGDMVF